MMTTQLQDGDLHNAREIWRELKNGTSGAHTRLKAAPEHVREEILKALVEAIERGETKDNPFGSD